MSRVTLEFPWFRPAADRLRAVRSCASELAESHEWCSDPYTAAENQEHIHRCRIGWLGMQEFTFAVVESRTGEWLGEVSIDEVNYDEGRGNLSFWIRSDSRRQGHATRAASIAAGFAFRELELRSLQILCAVTNLASQRVARALAARERGTLVTGPCARRLPTRRFLLQRDPYAAGARHAEDLSRHYLQHPVGVGEMQ